MRRMVTVWSAALPNLIADWPVVSEYFDDLVRPAHIARMLEQLMGDTDLRASQLTGFSQVASHMQTSRPPGELAAEAVLAEISSRT